MQADVVFHFLFIFYSLFNRQVQVHPRGKTVSTEESMQHYQKLKDAIIYKILK